MHLHRSLPFLFSIVTGNVLKSRLEPLSESKLPHLILPLSPLSLRFSIPPGSTSLALSFPFSLSSSTTVSSPPIPHPPTPHSCHRHSLTSSLPITQTESPPQT
eukprot:TRINITY_DN14014_c2_g1_i1.p1 TRINITY_DN14014_c2_g1~~TRINITY_DN14014_c2_g1_i1.p1  ORF type:complete len:103 (+),score=9.82 TRINITY_DN14014_c2_g1_i1:794-1102(+)